MIVSAAISEVALFLFLWNNLRISGQSHDGGSCILANGEQLQIAVRQEYRMLTDHQRNRYHAAINTLKLSGVYDQIATIHSNATTSGGAHGVPSFLPWHREFVKRSDKFFEIFRILWD